MSLVIEAAQFVVSLSKDGQVASQGTVSDALEHDDELQLELSQSREANRKEANIIDIPQTESTVKEKKNKGKLMREEETAEGHISLESSTLFSRNS